MVLNIQNFHPFSFVLEYGGDEVRLRNADTVVLAGVTGRLVVTRVGAEFHSESTVTACADAERAAGRVGVFLPVAEVPVTTPVAELRRSATAPPAYPFEVVAVPCPTCLALVTSGQHVTGCPPADSGVSAAAALASAVDSEAALQWLGDVLHTLDVRTAVVAGAGPRTAQVTDAYLMQSVRASYVGAAVGTTPSAVGVLSIGGVLPPLGHSVRQLSNCFCANYYASSAFRDLYLRRHFPGPYDVVVAANPHVSAKWSFGPSVDPSGFPSSVAATFPRDGSGEYTVKYGS